MKLSGTTAFLFAGLVVATSLFPGGASENGGRNVQADLRKQAGRPLSDEEKDIAEFILTFYYIRYGYDDADVTLADAAARMTDEEYANAIRQAVKVSQSGAAKGLLTMGKTGEKLLKAIIITAEDAARATGRWIDEKSREYDSKKK